MSDDIEIRAVASEEELDAVKELYRTQKAFLGLFPDGAFEQRAASNQIYVAWLDNRKAVGYVAFTTNGRYEVRIAHLCVSPAFRQRGFAKQLIAALVETHPGHARIRLNCRSDYPAADAWRRLKFSEVRRFPGKKLDGSELIAFSFPINETPLFDQIENDPLPVVVCDANVVIDIEDDSRPHHGSSTGLLVDWLFDEIDLRVTSEIFADFDRQDEPLRSDMISAAKEKWTQVSGSELDIAEALREVQRIMGPPNDDSSVSDQNHIATAATVEAAAFVTRDEGILEFRDEIQSSLGLRVLSPPEFITDYDSVLNSHRYQYRELSRSGIERGHVARVDEFDLELFIDQASGERLKSFKAELNEMLANPREWEIYRVSSKGNPNIALIAIHVLKNGAREVSRLRLNRKLIHRRFGRVLAEYLADQPLGAWRSGERRTVAITDPMASPTILDALSRRGWLQADNQWWRLSLPGSWTQHDLSSELDSLKDSKMLPGMIVNQLSHAVQSEHSVIGNEEKTQRLEKLIHPGKVTFGELPTWVIPIQVRWAQELFDFRLWDRGLFDPDTSLVINPDSAYYKRPRNSPTSSNGRILWYVSGNRSKGGGCIRACSALTKRVTGTAKNLFREFQRFGVYEWHHILQFFKQADTAALAIQFTDTELLENPLTLEDVNQILRSHGMGTQTFPSAVKIPDAAFHEIYSQSMKEKS